MDDRHKTGKPYRYVTRHAGQLSLAIPLWVSTVITGERWDVEARRSIR